MVRGHIALPCKGKDGQYELLMNFELFRCLLLLHSWHLCMSFHNVPSSFLYRTDGFICARLSGCARPLRRGSSGSSLLFLFSLGSLLLLCLPRFLELLHLVLGHLAVRTHPVFCGVATAVGLWPGRQRLELFGAPPLQLAPRHVQLDRLVGDLRPPLLECRYEFGDLFGAPSRKKGKGGSVFCSSSSDHGARFLGSFILLLQLAGQQLARAVVLRNLRELFVVLK